METIPSGGYRKFLKVLVMSDNGFESDEEWLDDANMEGEVAADNVPEVNVAPPKGRMTAYAFFVQESRRSHPSVQGNFAEFSKKCSGEWSRMSKTEKKRFQLLADEDRLRYESEMQDYQKRQSNSGFDFILSNKKVQLNVRGKRKKKDAIGPKKPVPAFFLFANAERSKVKEENPHFTAGMTSQELGRRWGRADPSVRLEYQRLAKEENDRYSWEMIEHEQKGNGIAAKKIRQGESEVQEEEEEEEVYCVQ